MAELRVPHPGMELLAATRSGRPPPYLSQLPAPPLPVPPPLSHLAASVPSTGAGASFGELLHTEEPLVDAVGRWSSYLSGPERRLAPRDQQVGVFIASLFHHIRTHGETQLCGWDLYHAHLFLSDGDLGLIFHAKEYPREFTTSSRAIAPVGDAAAAAHATRGVARSCRCTTRPSAGATSCGSRRPTGSI